MKKTLFGAFIVGLIFLLYVSNLSEQAETEFILPEVAGITGLDVSRYQGLVDFNKLKESGVRYVFVRATVGITIQDANFTKNFYAARNAGLVAGAYHFYETDDDPLEQLKNFIDVVRLQPGDLPPILDIEKLHKNDKLNLAANLQIFLDGLELYYGIKPIIYTGLNFSNKYICGFSEYPLWLAEYIKDEPGLPECWADWTFWQWTDTGSIEGIDGSVDLDRYKGEEAGFQELLIK